jgi:hypothetical protein
MLHASIALPYRKRNCSFYKFHGRERIPMMRKEEEERRNEGERKGK